MAVATDHERHFLDLVNQARSDNGLTPLRLELNLNDAADAHSAWMAASNTFDHEGAGGSRPTDRMRAAGMDLSNGWATAENIAVVSGNGLNDLSDEIARLHTNLMNSPGHRANILNPDLEVIGLGLAIGPLTYPSGSTWDSLFVTQNFARTGGVADLDLAGDAANDRLTGGAGTDHIDGRGGGDHLRGLAGADTLLGGAGRDLLAGEAHAGAGSALSGQVFRLYDTVFGRAPDLGGHQQWLSALALGERGLGDVVAGFMQSDEFRAIYDGAPDSQFVTLLYANVFGRTPSGSEAEGWVRNIALGMTRADVVRHFSESAEHQIRTAQALETFENGFDASVLGPQVYRLFRAIFDREPDAGGFSGWMDNLLDGMSFDEAVRQFMASSEFTATYGTASDGQFVTLLYQNVLKRSPDAGGLNAWETNLGNGMAREDVVKHFMASAEFVTATAPALAAFMRGFGADDVLAPGAGDSLLTGGLYADTFRFAATDDGSHTVTDLEPWDMLALEGFGYADTAAALGQMTQAGDDLRFADQGVTVLFLDTQLSDITPEMITIA